MPIEHFFDPTQPAVPDKLHVVAPESPEPGGAELKASIAARVREDSKAGRLTAEGAVRGLSPEFTRARVSELLAEMATENAYGDVKAIVAPSGRVYLFSEATLIVVEAQEKARAEEAKVIIVERIRADSRALALTSLAELEPLFPSADPAAREALLAELEADPRFHDVQRVAGPKGEVFFHSDAHVSGNYGKIMMRSKTMDVGWAIAEFVRDRAMIQPAPTKITVFRDPVFGIDFGKIEAYLLETIAKPEYADIKKLVHPQTGAVYLYSDKHLTEQQATYFMNWEEVERDRNP